MLEIETYLTQTQTALLHFNQRPPSATQFVLDDSQNAVIGLRRTADIGCVVLIVADL
jgi:hypothetical protein